MPTIWNASSVKIWEKYSGCRKTRGLQQAAVSPTQQIPYSVKQIFYSETERVVGDLNVDVDGSANVILLSDDLFTAKTQNNITCSGRIHGSFHKSGAMGCV